MAFQDLLDGFDDLVHQRSGERYLLARFARCDCDEFEKQQELSALARLAKVLPHGDQVLF